MSSIAVLKNDSQSVDLSPFLIKQLPRELGHYVFLLKDTRGQYADSTPRRVLVRIRISQRGPAARRGLLAPSNVGGPTRPTPPHRRARLAARQFGWPMSVIDTRLSLAQIGEADAYR